MINNNIPTDEEFALARAAMRKNDHGLSEVRSKILERYSGDGIHEFYIFFSPDKDLFVAYLFYQREEQIQLGGESGLSLNIKNSIFNELKKVRRGDYETIKVDLVVDSHENVVHKYEGDYFLYLR